MFPTCLILDLLIVIIDFLDEWKLWKVILMQFSSACFMLLDNGQEDQRLWTYWSQLFYEFHSVLHMLQVPFWFVTVLRYLNFIMFSKNVLPSLSLKDAVGGPAVLIYVSARLFGILSKMIVSNFHCFGLVRPDETWTDLTSLFVAAYWSVARNNYFYMFFDCVLCLCIIMHQTLVCHSLQVSPGFP